MKEGGRLKRPDVELLQEVSQETVFKILERVNDKLGGEPSSDEKIPQKMREKVLSGKDKKGKRYNVHLTQVPIHDTEEDETVIVSKVDPKDETAVTKFFFKPTRDSVTVESYAPRVSITSIVDNMPDVEFSSYSAVYNETQAALQTKAREDERNHGYSIVTEAEARELLDLLERSKPKKKRWWRSFSKSEHLK